MRSIGWRRFEARIWFDTFCQSGNWPVALKCLESKQRFKHMRRHQWVHGSARAVDAQRLAGKRQAVSGSHGAGALRPPCARITVHRVHHLMCSTWQSAKRTAACQPHYDRFNHLSGSHPTDSFNLLKSHPKTPSLFQIGLLAMRCVCICMRMGATQVGEQATEMNRTQT